MVTLFLYGEFNARMPIKPNKGNGNKKPDKRNGVVILN